MPIVKVGRQLIYFIHVPKCGGTSVGKYLTRRFGEMAFLERKYNARPEAERWTRSSPQHVPYLDRSWLFPPGFFDANLAVVRHPLDRLVSSYWFGLEIQRKISPDTHFGTWLERAHARRAAEPYVFDNHIRPMSEFIPPEDEAETTIFKIEDGLDAVIDWLDAQAGEVDEIRKMPRLQGRSVGRVERTIGPFVLSSEERAMVEELYAADYVRFGYDPDAARALSSAS